MANKLRHHWGDTNPVNIAVDSATVIEIGDLVYLNTDDAKPASSQADALSEAANQRVFAGKFLGVAMQQSRSGDTAPIRVATAGTFEFTAISATYEIGDLVGVDEATSGTALEDQVVKAVASDDLAIGKIARTESAATTDVLVTIQSAVVGHAGYRSGYVSGAVEALTAAAPAISLHTHHTTLDDTSNAVAATLANGLFEGQLKRITAIADAANGITVTTAATFDGTNNTLTMADDGDTALLRWDGARWFPLELMNYADGITAPVLSAV